MIFGFTEAQISGFFLTYGVGAFILYMLFIIVPVIGVLGVGGFVSGDAVTGLLGAVAGYVLGSKAWEGVN